MDAETVRRIEHDARQHALLAALWVLGREREYELRMPVDPTLEEAQAFAIEVLDKVGAAIRDDLLALAKEATDGR